MCGIFGFFDQGNEGFNVSGDNRAFAHAIRHRGPDDLGTWVDEPSNLCLVHTRLSIVDLSPAGHQPMESSCGRFVLVFNGEIYNHLVLRAELSAEASEPLWRGHSDSETLVTCFSVWGIEKTLRKAVGMFALALWDRQQKALTLARDRMGEKPLYWGWSKDTFLFGSELKALKAFPGFEGLIDRQALSLLLQYNYIPAPHSIYQGIQKLPAAHFIQIIPGRDKCDASPQPYWSMNRAVEQGGANQFEGSDLDAVDALERLLGKSISSQMLADVPLGAFLSGGVDSSAVAALMQAQSSQPVNTFAIGFDVPGYNEAEFAAHVADHLGTNHTELYVGPEEALGVIPLLPDMYCEPFADSSQIPTFLVSEMAKEHVTVALSGDGGDELFGGYAPYQFAPKVWRYMACMPLKMRKLGASIALGLPLQGKLRKLAELMPSESREHFYQSLVSHWPQPKDVVIGAGLPATVLSSSNAWPKVDDFESWMMAMDAQQYLCDDILVKVDRAAMFNSLETRVPMLDHRVVEFACQLPLHMKIRHGVGKWVLREVLYRHVPRSLIERPKKGFSVPLGKWLRGPLREWAEALLNESRLQREGYFKPDPVLKAWKQHLEGKVDNSRKLWSVLMFQAWLEVQ